MSVESDQIQALSNWLVEQGLGSGSYEPLVRGFNEGLVAAGIPVERSMMAMRTLHPAIDAHSLIWRRDGIVEAEDFITERGPSEQFLQSPLYHILQNRALREVRRRLVGPGMTFDFPVLHDFVANGMTDYVILKVPFAVASLSGFESGLLVSWTTAARDGFSERDLATLRRLAPRLALAISNRLLREVTVNVLDAYVGIEASRHILNGEIQRGALEEIDAVILFFDLRGFTALVDRHGSEIAADLLNGYFERIVTPILERGGEVLKFLGDGVLATFNLVGQAEADICRIGLDAALEALASVSAWNGEREAENLPTMALDVGMHKGPVHFGNVGAPNRLDFTVVGRAVNEASRIEALAEDVGRHLVISETFAQAATQCAERLVSLGRHELRGVSGDQELFTVA